MAPINAPSAVKFFIYDPTSCRVPWSYIPGPALQYCLDTTSTALLSPPVLDLYVSTLLGDPFSSSSHALQNDQYQALINAIRVLLTSSLIPVNLTRVPQFARTIPSPTTYNHLPIILLDHELVFSVDKVNDPFLCLTLVTMIMYEVNHWLRLRLLSGSGLINCDYGSTVEQAEAVQRLVRGVGVEKNITEEIFKGRLFSFEQRLLGGVTVLLLNHKQSLCHYIDGFALEKEPKTKDGESEVRILESRSDVVTVLAQLKNGCASLPLFDLEALRIDDATKGCEAEDERNAIAENDGRDKHPPHERNSDFLACQYETQSSLLELSEWEEADDHGLRCNEGTVEGGYIYI
ncbi:hypothetical protein H0H87_008032 [Tephrocybe sp. NHM501043]|nr:hypothetical protein H0H87_008032 [Tephrocybe sp. NHM501043]